MQQYAFPNFRVKLLIFLLFIFVEVGRGWGDVDFTAAFWERNRIENHCLTMKIMAAHCHGWHRYMYQFQKVVTSSWENLFRNNNNNNNNNNIKTINFIKTSQ